MTLTLTQMFFIGFGLGALWIIGVWVVYSLIWPGK